MRVTTAFNRILRVPGATVRSVAFTPVGIVVGLRLRSRVLRCPCGFSTKATYDRSVRRWRHLDLGATKLFLSAEIRRLSCPACARVRTEEVPWARPGARHTKDLEDVVAYLAQRVDKTTITRLLRISWEAVAGMVVRVVASCIDEHRLDELYRIGVDEVAYRKGHRYLTVAATTTEKEPWCGPGRGRRRPPWRPSSTSWVRSEPAPSRRGRWTWAEPTPRPRRSGPPGPSVRRSVPRDQAGQ